MTRQEHDHDAKSQLDKFKDLARELECDEDEAAFKEKVRAVAAPKAPVESGAKRSEK